MELPEELLPPFAALLRGRRWAPRGHTVGRTIATHRALFGPVIGSGSGRGLGFRSLWSHSDHKYFVSGEAITRSTNPGNVRALWTMRNAEECDDVSNCEREKTANRVIPTILLRWEIKNVVRLVLEVLAGRKGVPIFCTFSLYGK